MKQQAEEKQRSWKPNACSCLCMTGCAVPCFFVSLFVLLAAFYHQYGENKDESPMFNAEKGKNFSYEMTYLRRFCEFDIMETDFLDWCKNWNPVEIETLPDLSKVDFEEDMKINYKREIPLNIPRYCYKKPAHIECDPWNCQCQLDPSGKTDKACFRRVDDGYYYERRGSNGGGVYVLYDRDNDRCYIEWNHH